MKTSTEHRWGNPEIMGGPDWTNRQSWWLLQDIIADINRQIAPMVQEAAEFISFE